VHLIIFAALLNTQRYRLCQYFRACASRFLSYYLPLPKAQI